MITSVTPYRDTFVVATGDKVYLYADGALTPLRFRDQADRQVKHLEFVRDKLIEQLAAATGKTKELWRLYAADLESNP